MISTLMLRKLSDPVLLLLLCCVLLLVTILFLHQHRTTQALPPSLSLPLPLHLPAGLLLPELVPHHHPIWFVETSGRGELTPRELCAVESAAFHHPNITVYMLFTSPLINRNQVKEMMSMYSNLQPRYLNLDSLFSGSPLAQLWLSGQVHSSKWPVSHLSDLVR